MAIFPRVTLPLMLRSCPWVVKSALRFVSPLRVSFPFVLIACSIVIFPNALTVNWRSPVTVLLKVVLALVRVVSVPRLTASPKV